MRDKVFVSLLLTLLCFAHAGQSMVSEKWDVVVVGGEPEAITAGIAAARCGARTLLVTKDPIVGHTMTLAELNFLDMNYDSKGNLLTCGLFSEWWNLLGKKSAFAPEKALAAFNRLIASENLTVRTKTRVISLEKDSQKLKALVLKSADEQVYHCRAKTVIDGTGDGNLAAMAGAGFNVGRQDLGRPDLWMAPTLIFAVDGVNWARVKAYLQGQKNPSVGANETAAWGYWEVSELYRPQDPDMYLRGLNIGRTDSDSVLVNALLIFNVDVLDPASRQAAIARGTAEAQRIVTYLRGNAPGFENAVFAGAASELYVRESRYLQGIYCLTLEDIEQERHPWDEIAVGSYPVDIQPAERGASCQSLYDPVDGYGIPFRCLVPQAGPANLLVVGRAASYSSQAAGSARVIPIGMVVGQAAGTAAAVVSKWPLNFREVANAPAAIRRIQNRLREQGAYLRPAPVR